jgi:polysaccharide transporter, PST family
VKTYGMRLLKNKIAQNAASLYVVQACRKLVPLFTIPYLARVLGPSGWGDVAFTLSMGDFIALFAEFGFLLSATRELAQNRDSKDACGTIAGGTLGAQALLSLLGVLAAWGVSTQVPLLSSHPRLLASGLLYGAMQGTAPLWLFQGLERMKLAASLEVCSKTAALLAIFLFVHTPRDEWKVLAFQSFTPAVTLIVGLWMAHSWLGFRMPTGAMIWRSLRAGWPMFLLRSGVATYSTANVLVLGMFAPASVVGYYASAEKLSKAIAGLLMPIRDAFYPRLSQLAAHSPEENKRLTRISAYVEGGCGLILSVITWAGAGMIVRTVFGKSFEAAVPILQILAVLPFILSLTDAIGFQSLLPAGKESHVTKAIITGAVVNLALAVVLAPRFMGSGMAVSVVIAEAAVCGTLVWIVARTTKLFRKKTLDQPDIRGFASTLVDVPTRTHE